MFQTFYTTRNDLNLYNCKCYTLKLYKGFDNSFHRGKYDQIIWTLDIHNQQNSSITSALHFCL